MKCKCGKDYPEELFLGGVCERCWEHHRDWMMEQRGDEDV